MNRKKKINKILSKKMKKTKSKNLPNSKPRYISKAEREADAIETESEPKSEPTTTR